MACSFCIHLKTPSFNPLDSCGMNGAKIYAKRKFLNLINQNCIKWFAVSGEPTACLGSGYLLTVPYDRGSRLLRCWPFLSLPNHLLSCSRHRSIKELSLITAYKSCGSIRNIAEVNHRYIPQLGTKLKWFNNPYQVLPCLVHRPFLHV